LEVLESSFALLHLVQLGCWRRSSDMPLCETCLYHAVGRKCLQNEKISGMLSRPRSRLCLKKSPAEIASPTSGMDSALGTWHRWHIHDNHTYYTVDSVQKCNWRFSPTLKCFPACRILQLCSPGACRTLLGPHPSPPRESMQWC
jgi:hypothetical protein